jgi:hypothetical protein
MKEKETTRDPLPLNGDQGPQAKKREYKSPILVAYGSVRQLTGAVSGGAGDGTGMHFT